ncbi:MAG: hypothetical protein IJ990_01675, partial [Alistipes sp.]|nr:hypothetical protein [Alistipes sp.]
MKAQPVLLMVFFAGVVGMVAWSYYAVTRPAVQEQQSKQHERESLTADLQRCCHRKQSQSAQYEQYAHTASVEDAPSAATLFRALAHSERVQEFYCAELIGKLGSSYQSPSRILIFQGSTPTNIARSLAYAYVIDEDYLDIMDADTVMQNLKMCSIPYDESN